MNKKIQISSAIYKIEKKFGKGTIISALKFPVSSTISHLNSGSMLLDIALGIGGYPLGRIIEIFGPEASGKTTIALHAVSKVSYRNNYSVFIDIEHTLDINYAKNLGILLSNLLIIHPENGEQAFEIINILSELDSIKLIVLDSVAALVSKNEINSSFQDMQIGLQARLMSKSLRRIAKVISKNKTSVIFVNQIRMKIGVLFGNPETTPGGNALKFYASIRIESKRTAYIKHGLEIIGNRTRLRVIKNKLSSPFKHVDVDIMYGKGISRSGEVLDLGIKANILRKKGKWIYFNQKPIGQGREYIRQIFVMNNKLRNIVIAEIFNKIAIKIEKHTLQKIKV